MNYIPFSESEIVKGADGKYTIHPPITPRENFLRACKGETPLWIPLKSDSKSFNPKICADTVARAYVIEGKPYTGPKGGLDYFGIPWTFIPSVGGSMVTPGTPPLLDDISQWREKVIFPDIDSWDWAGAAEENKEYLQGDIAITTWIFNGLFERLISFMEFENAAMALIDEDQQDDVHALFQALVDFYKKLIDHHKDYFDLDMVYFHDDWGSQRSPFFSLDTCREMLVPYLKQIVDHCHERGILFDFHSCGMNEPLVPAMIEAGVDMWAGQNLNDINKLIGMYGDKMLFGIRTPYGPGEAVPEDDAELEKVFDEFLAPYLPHLKNGRLFYLMEFRPTDRMRAIYYRRCRQALDPSK